MYDKIVLVKANLIGCQKKRKHPTFDFKQFFTGETYEPLDHWSRSDRVHDYRVDFVFFPRKTISTYHTDAHLSQLSVFCVVFYYIEHCLGQIARAAGQVAVLGDVPYQRAILCAVVLT